MAEIEPVVVDEIVKLSDLPEPKIAKRVSEQFGRFIPVRVVKSVLSSQGRRQAITDAKDQAAQGLGDKVALMDRVSQALQDAFFDPHLGLDDKLNVSKELRQWTNLNIKTTGLYDEEHDTLFVIGEAWDLSQK